MSKPYRRVEASARLFRVVLLVFVQTGFIVQSDVTAESQWQRPDKEARLSYRIMEERSPGLIVGNLWNDTGISESMRDGTLELAILSGHMSGYFSINSSTGHLLTSRRIDRETVCSRNQIDCQVMIDVAIVRPILFFRVFKVTVEIEDLNDNAPVFAPDVMTLNISESVPTGTFYVLPSPLDFDSEIFGVRSYNININSSELEIALQENEDGSRDLRLTVTGKLDREERRSYNGHVIAIDGGSPPLSGALELVVMVTDVNDNSPKFEKSFYNVSVFENLPVGSILTVLTASDPDEGLNGMVRYELVRQASVQGGSGGGKFAIDPTTGDLFLHEPLDFETESSHSLLVSARDLGQGSVNVYARVMVSVMDSNDCPPNIRVNAVSGVEENTDPGAFVAQISVDDADEGDNGRVYCFVSSRLFVLEMLYPTVFKVITNSRFDREQQDLYKPEITCRDFGQPPLEVTAQLLVEIHDVNDFVPAFDRNEYVVNVPENCSTGTVLLRVNASDDDSGENAAIRYQLEYAAQTFLSIDNVTGLVIVKGGFDFENCSRHQFLVTAMDLGFPISYSASATIVVNVFDVNDEAPVFSQSFYSFGTFENQPPGTEIGYVSAFDRDGPPFDRFTFSISGAGKTSFAATDSFEVEDDTGRITATRSLDREQYPVHQLTVTAVDSAFPYHHSTTNVTVYVADRNDNAPLIEFPAFDGQLVRLSTSTPPGQVFTAVRARDSDLGENARLVFTLAKGNEEGRFDIDPVSGEISMSKQGFATSHLMERFQLVVLVRDCGKPEKSAVAMLDVQVEKEAAMAEEGPHESSKRAENGSTSWRVYLNQMIVVFLACVCVTLLISLITIIVCVRVRRAVAQRRNRKIRTSRFVYQEDLRIDRPPPPLNSLSKVQTAVAPAEMLNDDKVQDVQRQVDETCGSLRSGTMRTKRSVQFDMNTIQVREVETANRWNGERNTVTSFQGSSNIDNQSSIQFDKADPTVDETEVNRLLTILRQKNESPSESSSCIVATNNISAQS